MEHFKSLKTSQAVRLLYTQYNVENYKRAVELLESAADEGDADALYFLSRCYLGDEFIWEYAEFTNDEDKAKRLLAESVKQGSALGVLGALRIQELTPELEEEMPFEDVKEARDMVLKMAESGQPFCQYMIGNTYFWDDVYEIDGLPHPLFNNEAFLALGNEQEQEEKMTEIESEVSRMAVYWFEKSVYAGYTWCAGNLLNIYKKGAFGLPKDIDKYHGILQVCADAGNPVYQAELADQLYEEKRYEEAIYYYKTAGQSGQLSAWFDAGYMYMEGLGVIKDPRMAVRCYQKAAEGGYIPAKRNLGICHFQGKGTDVDYERAFYYLKQAADAGDTGAYGTLGICYLKGLGVSTDYEVARQLLEGANKTPLSLNGLGQIYADGLGVMEDIEIAVEFFQQAGDDEGKVHLANFKKGLFGKWKRRKVRK